MFIVANKLLMLIVVKHFERKNKLACLSLVQTFSLSKGFVLFGTKLVPWHSE
jgi:hypothetical protein